MAHRALVLLILIGILAVNPGNVVAMRSTGVIGLQETQNVEAENPRVLKKASSHEGRMITEQSAPSVKGKLDPYASSKRRVRGGSDPIHNRPWVCSGGIPFLPQDSDPREASSARSHLRVIIARLTGKFYRIYFSQKSWILFSYSFLIVGSMESLYRKST